MEISPCIIFPIPRFLWINSSFLFKYHTTWWQPRFLFSLLYFQGRNPQYYWMSSGVGKKSTDLGPSFWRKLVGKKISVGLHCLIYETELISKVSSKLWFMIPKLTWHWTWIYWERRMMRQSLQEQADKHRQRVRWARAWSEVLPASSR